MLERIARHLGALILGTAVSLAAVAQAPAATPADSPGWNNPPASWEETSEMPQYASVPGHETNRLIQGAGRQWRALRNGPLTQYGGWLLVLVPAGIMLFYWVKGPIRLRGKPTGRLIERFNGIERAAHWMMAGSFVLLAITGIVILFGKHVVLPWLGYGGFSSLLATSKAAHDFVGPLFIFSLAVSFLVFVKDNLVEARDFKWLLRFAGAFGKPEVPSGRFNGGEKAWFWGGVVLLGTVVSATGLMLDFPNWNQGREAMQYANLVHAVAAIMFISAAFGHIYIGTIGMEGAYRSMHDGYVDEQWAKEHHVLWYHTAKRGSHERRTTQTEAGSESRRVAGSTAAESRGSEA
jgi:formate dehydrogenase subunit gamma